MRLTVCLEGETEGRVLASLDMQEIVKMTTTDDIEKSNFNKDMFKACTDSAYECGYEKGKADEIEEVHTELSRELAELNECDMTYDNLKTFAYRIKGYVEQLKEQKK